MNMIILMLSSYFCGMVCEYFLSKYIKKYRKIKQLKKHIIKVHAEERNEEINEEQDALQIDQGMADYLQRFTFKTETNKHAIWHGKITKQFKKWKAKCERLELERTSAGGARK